MVTITPPPPALSRDLALYYARDSLLDELPVFIFYGSSTTTNLTQNASRIQAHIFSLAGFQAFPRLTVAPTSPLYTAVSHLPRDLQGDEVYRGLAVSLLSYYAALSSQIKASLREAAGSRRSDGLGPMMFDEMHAGNLAANMEQVSDVAQIASYLTIASPVQSISWLDVDVILPAGTMDRATTLDSSEVVPFFDEKGLPVFNYGEYEELVSSLGQPSFLPTSKLKRAPSRPMGHSKGRNLTKDTKIAIRRELCEFVDTENNYQGKLSVLVGELATAFRDHGQSATIEALFPASLDEILTLSAAFYEDILSVLETTEDDAIRDIEGQDADISQAMRRDPTGATDFAKALLRWLPKFVRPYQGYLRSSTHVVDLIAQVQNESPIYAATMREIGEQRLKSDIIEPVQRLPRYSLLIDNVLNHLPTSHSAMSGLLKARDIVTNICSLDTLIDNDVSRAPKILQSIVRDWPLALFPRGRLITAIDVREIQPSSHDGSEDLGGIILLFPEKLVLLCKLNENALSARGIIAEVDRPRVAIPTDIQDCGSTDKELLHTATYELSCIRFLESEDQKLIFLIDSIQADQAPRVFALQGPYEGKASRFSEEIIKARIEDRYPEALRDEGNWALRTITSREGLNMMFALSELDPPRSDYHIQPCMQVKLWVSDTALKKSLISENDQRAGSIVAQVVSNNDNTYHLLIEGGGRSYTGANVSSEGLVGLLSKRLGDICRAQHQQATNIHIAHWRKILRAVPLLESQREAKHRIFRPVSPVKLLSRAFANHVSQTVSPAGPRRDMRSMKDVPSLPPPTPSKDPPPVSARPESQHMSSKVTVVDSAGNNIKASLTLLEDTFVAYLVALRQRSGNVVGKVLRGRAGADERFVNELYNALLEDPGRIQMAAEVSVDVLFAAFEMFLRRAWRERMGPLISPIALQQLQASFDTGKPTLFAQDFKKVLEDMSPQSKRAFAGTIRLLSDLLDASGNDGDRGVLIASFAEALVFVGNPHDYITLLDRLVDDFENLFEEIIEKPGSSGSATSSLTRSRSFNASSLGSNTSSLRKKFGLGSSALSREGSKKEPESKVSSMWRTLSKNSRNPGESDLLAANISKASLVRSRSTDTDPKTVQLLPSDAQRRPPSSGSTTSQEQNSRPGSAHNTLNNLSSIKEDGAAKPALLPKKKRRSSLSDLVKLQLSEGPSTWSPSPARKLPVPRQSPSVAKTLPKTPDPKQPPFTKCFDPSSSPSGLPRRLDPTRLKENASSKEASNAKGKSPSPRNVQTKRPTGDSPQGVTISSYKPQKRTVSRSNLPTPKSGLSERAWPPNSLVNGGRAAGEPGKSLGKSPGKLRLQNPQKLQSRLSQERRKSNSAESTLQGEIDKIGKELSTLETRPSATSSTGKSQPPSLASLSRRLDTLSKNLQTFTTEQKATTTSIRNDLESSLQVLDKKAQQLDELYKEANAENEALYDRFNDELGKIVARVRKGEGVDEIRQRLMEAVKEVGVLKVDRARLRREVVDLKSLVKD